MVSALVADRTIFSSFSTLLYLSEFMLFSLQWVTTVALRGVREFPLGEKLLLWAINCLGQEGRTYIIDLQKKRKNAKHNANEGKQKPAHNRVQHKHHILCRGLSRMSSDSTLLPFQQSLSKTQNSAAEYWPVSDPELWPPHEGGQKIREFPLREH